MFHGKNLINDKNMMLELRDGGAESAKFIKVTNPDNPAEHVYLRQDVYNNMLQGLDDGSMQFSFKKLWTKAKELVNKVIKVAKGGGSAGGGSGGFPILTDSNGQPTIVVTTQNPPIVALPDKGTDGRSFTADKTALYFGGALLLGGLIYVMKK